MRFPAPGTQGHEQFLPEVHLKAMVVSKIGMFWPRQVCLARALLLLAKSQGDLSTAGNLQAKPRISSRGPHAIPQECANALQRQEKISCAS